MFKTTSLTCIMLAILGTIATPQAARAEDHPSSVQITWPTLSDPDRPDVINVTLSKNQSEPMIVSRRQTAVYTKPGAPSSTSCPQSSELSDPSSSPCGSVSLPVGTWVKLSKMSDKVYLVEIQNNTWAKTDQFCVNQDNCIELPSIHTKHLRQAMILTQDTPFEIRWGEGLDQAITLKVM